jgi:hypothetical protein
VISADGTRVGIVQHVLADSAADIFEGLEIDTRLGPGGLRHVDADQIAAVYNTRVELTLDASAVRRLPGSRRRGRDHTPTV